MGLATDGVTAVPREVQIRFIDIETGIVQLFNFGNTDEDLSRYQFRTHDDNEALR